MKKAHDHGVVNIEMESLQFGAFCYAMNVQAAVICVAILNRLNGDQVSATPEELAEYESRPVRAVARFIRQDFEAFLAHKEAEELGLEEVKN